MNDIGLHPDAGRPEPPDLAPVAIGVKLILEVTVDVYGNPEDGYGDLKLNLEDIVQRGIDEGLVTALGDTEMELVDHQVYTERM